MENFVNYSSTSYNLGIKTSKVSSKPRAYPRYPRAYPRYPRAYPRYPRAYPRYPRAYPRYPGIHVHILHSEYRLTLQRQTTSPCNLQYLRDRYLVQLYSLCILLQCNVLYVSMELSTISMQMISSCTPFFFILASQEIEGGQWRG